MRFIRQRRELVELGRQLNTGGLNQGTSGNLSVRVEGGLLVTPTGVACDRLEPDDPVEIHLDGRVADHQRAPSSEWRIHRDLYATRDDLHAVVHVHSMFATTLSMVGMTIPAVHYMVAVAGGHDVRCAPYATFGTQALSDAVIEAMVGRKACLMANHGMLAAGTTLAEALRIAIEVETLAAQYWRALQIGRPNVLDDAEMARVVEKFRTYGQPGRS